MSKLELPAPVKPPAKVAPKVAPKAAPKKACDGLPSGVPVSEHIAAIPGGVTHYFPITLGGATGSPDGCPVTGVFVPRGLKYQAHLDIVLFFHGSKEHWTTAYDYWKPGNRNGIKLREAVNDAGKNVILVVPTMGWHPGGGGSATGVFDTKGADAFLEEVRDRLVPYPPFDGKSPSIGKVALAAHSGGGEPMLQQWMLMKKYRSHVRSIWGFDSTYEFGPTMKLGTGSNAGNWLMWAGWRPDIEFHFYYKTGTGPAKVADDIEQAATGRAPFPGTKDEYMPPLHNVHVWSSSDEHYAQLNNNFPVRMSSRVTPFPP